MIAYLIDDLGDDLSNEIFYLLLIFIQTVLFDNQVDLSREYNNNTIK